MKAKDLAEILLLVPDWDVMVEEDGWGASPANVDNIAQIKEAAAAGIKHGNVTLYGGN